tara:strand:- start:91793 stop:92386 length:594 start_codon:yes stop_codon:yes gene_type:complete
MFTGLVEETGTVLDCTNNSDGRELIITAEKTIKDLKVNDSICCSGICLTVTDIEKNSFKVFLVKETLDRTTAKYWEKGTIINLERSLLPTTRIGGHFVQGHVDTISKIIDISAESDSGIWEFELNKKIDRYIVEKGSITLDGISLTIANRNKNDFSVALIPHTMFVTNLNQKNIGDFVNVEVDIMAKYIESFIKKIS